MEESAKIMVAAAVCARKDTLYSVTYTTALNISVSRTSNYLELKLNQRASSGL